MSPVRARVRTLVKPGRNDFKGLSKEEALAVGERAKHYGKGVALHYEGTSIAEFCMYLISIPWKVRDRVRTADHLSAEEP